MSEHHTHHHTPHTTDEFQHALVEHDEWFRHSADEPTHQESHGDFNPYVVMAFLFVTIGLVFGTAVFVVMWFARLSHDQKVIVQERNPEYNQEYVERADQWKADLYGEPTWIDEKNNLIRIPIGDAMDAVVKEYASAK